MDLNTGQPVEVFYADGQRIGSQLQHAIQYACVLISLLLQYGVDHGSTEKSPSSVPVLGQPQPATVIGVIAQTVKEGVTRGRNMERRKALFDSNKKDNLQSRLPK
ncbi:MAG: hypothetical protein GY717_10140 [Rhodobacteraceae bacterium]|nr:hypothetical protein [Paracoccaceae bacterium]